MTRDASQVTNAALRIVVKVMPWIPPWLKRLLAGGRRVTIDGNTLDPTLQLVLATQRSTPPGGLSATDDPEVARVLTRNSSALLDTRVAVPTTDLTIPGPDGPLRARHYRPTVAGAAPLLVFFHGGGFVVGDIESHDGLCRMICRDATIHVLSVDYRLAPEHKAPAAVDDCVAAYQWALGHAAELGADPSRIGVGGDSAGEPWRRSSRYAAAKRVFRSRRCRCCSIRSPTYLGGSRPGRAYCSRTGSS